MGHGNPFRRFSCRPVAIFGRFFAGYLRILDLYDVYEERALGAREGASESFAMALQKTKVEMKAPTMPMSIEPGIELESSKSRRSHTVPTRKAPTRPEIAASKPLALVRITLPVSQPTAGPTMNHQRKFSTDAPFPGRVP